MTTTSRRRRRPLIVSLAVMLAGITIPTGANAGGAPVSSPSMLALGDSYPFGRPATAGFVGYPELVGAVAGLAVTNASCPGETSGSLLSATSPQQWCHDYRQDHRLRVDYGGSQADFAVTYLRSHRATRLVTVDVGGNDFLYVLDTCASSHPGDPEAAATCFYDALPELLRSLGQHLTTLVQVLRSDGGYRGPIVIKNITVVDGGDTDVVAVADLANQVIADVAAETGTRLADAAIPWTRIAARRDGDACAAGLLYRIDPTTCDDHPSQWGHAVLAATVLSAPRI